MTLLPLLAHRREAVANKASGDDRRAAIANAGDVSPIQKGEWIMVAPYGDHPGRRPGRLQYFHKPQADAMVSEFNSWKAKLGRLFRGRSIFIGHPDADPVNYKDDRRLGKIMQLEARADGLWAEPDWNSLGNENIDEGWWVYPSPYWDAPKGKARFEPDRLISIGLTNNPRIVVSEPVSNTDTNETMDRQKLLEKLGLPPEATDEEILAKIEAFMNAAQSDEDKQAAEEMKNSLTEAQEGRETAENALTTEQEKVTGLETQLQEARTAHANSLLDHAIEGACIEKADREKWEKDFSDDFEKASNALGEIKPKLNTQQLELEKSREKVSNERERREQIANAVDAEMEKGKSYLEATAAVKANPEFKSLFEAMHQPGSDDE